MARTKQTARKSTGGKAPRLQLAQMPPPQQQQQQQQQQQEQPQPRKILRDNISEEEEEEEEETEEEVDEGAYDSESSNITEEEDDLSSYGAVGKSKKWVKNKKALPVLPSKKKKIVSEPVNFYGSSLQNNPYTTEIDRKTTGLNEILSPSVLKQQKKTLSKHGDAKRFNPVTLTRLEVMRDLTVSTTSSLPISEALDYLKTQVLTTDLTTLDMSGLEQLNDAFFYMVYERQINFPCLQNLSLNGCYRITDDGILWLSAASVEKLVMVELCGCKNLSEISLYSIINKWQSSLKSINMSGTNVGILPDYSGSLRLKGCPLISPTESTYRDATLEVNKNRPKFEQTTFKMVILTEDNLPWSPLAVMTNEQDVSARKRLTVKTNWTFYKDLQLNVFEAPIENGFYELLLSEGSIVVLPYLLAEDGPDQDYGDQICNNMTKIFSKCPNCVFILMGLAAEPGLESIADRYKNMIRQQFKRRADELEKELGLSTERNSFIRTMSYGDQQKFGNGRTLYKQSEQITGHGQQQTLFKKDLLLSTVLHVGGNKDKPARAVLTVATESLKHHFPWYFLPYQEELNTALKELVKNKFPPSKLDDIFNTSVPKEVKQSFHETNAFSHVGKIFSTMKTMGEALHFPFISGCPTMTDFTVLESIYQKMMSQPAPRKASWRFLGSNFPCWTTEDVKGICDGSKEMASMMIKLLESFGVLLKIPRDPWTTDLGGATCAYVLIKDLPMYPTTDIEDFWPDGVPYDEYQSERYFSFHPGIPDSFFPNVLRHCSCLGELRLIWNKGIIIQKGPVLVLLELLSSYDNTPVLHLGIRIMSTTQTPKGSPVLTILDSTRRIYQSLVKNLIVQYKVYAVETIPCETCLPSRNRYKTVNARTTEIGLLREHVLKARRTAQQTVTCKNDGAVVDLDSALGMSIHMREINPCHSYLGCLPSFSSYNRCMMCHSCGVDGPECEGNLDNGSSSWNCSCNREAQMCDKCGICQRCVIFLTKLETNLFPYFREKDGSFVSLIPEEPYSLDQELTPNYCPLLEIRPIRGSFLHLVIKIGSSKLVYDSAAGTLKLITAGNQERNCNPNDLSLLSKEGASIVVELKFVEADLDEMDIILRLRGLPAYRHRCSTQGCPVTLTARHPMSVVIALPKQKKVKDLGFDELGERATCSGSNSVAGFEASLVAGKRFAENALFQAGGVNFSGSSMVTLPKDLTMHNFQYPSYQLVKKDNVYHPLCYTRTKISDVMTFSGTAAVPESWSVYRMIHFLDSKGFSVEPKTQLVIADKAYQLLWAWHFIMLLMPKVTLPREITELLPQGLLNSETRRQIEAGLFDLLKMEYWRILLCVDLEYLLPVFEDQYALTQQTKILADVLENHYEETGMIRTVSKFNEENILYLCDGHYASMRVEEGLTKVLPEIYGNYSLFLMSIDMPANQIKEIPEEMFKVLPNLAEFDCSNNFIETLPASVGNCKKLYSLTLRENNLHDLPDSLTECKELFRLDIASNVMTEFPAVVTKLTWLNRLYASHMMLTSLPEDIGNLVNLEKLLINGNCLTKLPASFAKLKNLEELSMSGVPWCGVSKSRKIVPYDMFINFLKTRNIDRWLEAHDEDRKEMFQYFDEDSNGTLDLKELGKLNAAIFNIFPRFGYKGTEAPDDDEPSGFPEEILECTSLQHLDLYYQGFVSIPPGISNLQDLRLLNLSHNPNLLSLPAELGTVTSLTKLELEECPLLKTPPKEIRAKGFSTTFAYLQRLMSGSMECKRTKLMLVGLGGAGKTSLVKALLSKDDKTDLTQGENITDGIDISTWTVSAGDEKITYSVWDFAGQTVYYNTHQFFLSNRAVYLLLWNVRLGYEHAGLDFWLSSVSVQAPKAPIFVVGSHVDQVSKYDFPINEMRQRYKQIAGFHFISSFTGEGIKELKEQLFECTLQEEYMGEQIPEVWLRFERMVIDSRSSCDVIEYSALEKMANMSGIFDKTEVHQAVQFLHDLGSLQHFTTESLKTKVVVNPQWIVDVMACVVSVKNSPIHEGRLKHKDISAVWKDYPKELHDWLLKLTEEYDLTFPLENEPVNLVPCLLPEEQPQFTWPEVEKDSDIKENKMIYKFDYLPAGLFNRGQVRLHQISDAALIWKKGSFLKKNGHIALILQSRGSELVVSVQGPRPENVIFLVHEVFEGLISESFRGVTYDYLTPCPDCLKQGLRDPHMFAASTIRRAVGLKAPFLQCVKYFHTISCVDLLACMPPDNHSDFDLHLVQSVRNLRDLRKDLSADIFMSYCGKDAPISRGSVIHPATVRDDLEKHGYKCWFQEKTKTYTVDEMARALIDSEVFVAFVSVDYAKDEDCTNIFKYARLTLRKPMVVVAVGEGFEWKQSKLGILLSDEVFVNMTNAKKPNYQTKFEELLKSVGEKTNRTVGDAPTPPCFFSYTWVNSAQAVKLGTRSVPGAIGYGDPREIKQHLEDHGIRCWIDVERVGQNGLFDDIAEGLLSAKVVVICVSDEYADSATCRIEFRYAASTLKLPIIMAVVGKGNRWRASEVGVLSLGYPLVSFQEKSETAHDSLLTHVKEALERQSEPSQKEIKNKQNEEHKNLSFQELFELAQRKLLRQLSFYAEHQDVDIYPRLFVADFAKSRTSRIEKQDEETSEKKRPLSRMLSRDGHTLSKKLSDVKAAFKMQRFTVHILCEHDEGWHSVTDPLPLPDDFGHAYLEMFSPFLARVTAIMKYNKTMKFQYLEEELGQDYLKWLEESPQATMSDYQSVYHDFRKMVIDADLFRTMGNLMRCRLPNGKTIWLCDRHRNSMRVTVLGTEAVVSDKQLDTDSGTSSFLVEGLRALDHKTYTDKFKSTRKSLKRKDSSITPKVESLPNLPTPKKKSKHKKSKEDIVEEKKDEMEKTNGEKETTEAQSSLRETKTNSQDQSNIAVNRSDNKMESQSVSSLDKLSQFMENKTESQSMEYRRDSQSSNKLEAQSGARPKEPSAVKQMAAANDLILRADDKNTVQNEVSKENAQLNRRLRKESYERLEGLQASPTDAEVRRNVQRQQSITSLKNRPNQTPKAAKPKSRLCSVM